MSDHDHGSGMSELSDSKPEAQEAESFREDLYLRSVGTAETMARILDGQAETLLSKRQETAADGRLHEDRADVEMARASDSMEHARFMYNWAHVMLTTRVLDVLKTLSSHFVELRPKRKYHGCDFLRLKSEFADRFGIEFSKCPTGDSFLEGMVLARNKIVHNGAMAWEASSHPDAIVVEGTCEEWSPSKFDQDFVNRFPEYADGADRITVTEELFKSNAGRVLEFVTWVGEQVDAFVQLPTTASARCSPL
jgi:hypothetical protein